MAIKYCKPIRYEGCQNCTVEFADTPGRAFTSWRLRSDEGPVRTGFCDEGAVRSFYNGPIPGDLDGIRPVSINDCRALRATWPTWEAIRDPDADPEFSKPLDAGIE